MYLPYPSSLDPKLTLYADFDIPEQKAHLHLNLHGWHGCVKTQHRDNVEAVRGQAEWFFIRPEMRGRGDSNGKPDCNGNELQDAIDAVEYAKQHFADKILEPEKVYLSGGSGGGGNVLALLGKFPDYFCRAHADCGIYDYAAWYRGDTKGEFRDEMEGKGWIGGNPDTNAEAYKSRSGITTVCNIQTPTILFHGENDIRVPAEQARCLMGEVRRQQKCALVHYFELPNCGGKDHWTGITPELMAFRESTASAFMALPSPAIRMPRSGVLTVAGYIATKDFSIRLESVDNVAQLRYDLDKNIFELSKPGTIMQTSK